MWQNWYKPSFWRWWWQQQSTLHTKVPLLLAGAVLGVAGGYAASAALGSSANSAAGEVTTVRAVRVTVGPDTVQRLVTVRKDGQVIRTTIASVQTVVGPGRTDYVTQTTYRANGETRTVTAPAEPAPSVTAPGKTVTIDRLVTVRQPLTSISTRVMPTTVTRTRVVTQPRTVTNQQVVTNQQTVVAEEVPTQQAQPVTARRTAQGARR